MEPIEDDGPLSVAVGGRTVAENLRAAIDGGFMRRGLRGTLILLRDPERVLRVFYTPLTSQTGSFRQPCTFLNNFLFQHAYRRAQVPYGCRDCFKVKVASGGVRAMLALRPIVKAIDRSAKSGIETDLGNDEVRFATFFYNLGLENAHAVYRELRKRVAAHPWLAGQTVITIKRGCTNYEMFCGPSNNYTFDPALADAERFLQTRFRRRKPTMWERWRNRGWHHVAAALVRQLLRRTDPSAKSARPKTVDYTPTDDV